MMRRRKDAALGRDRQLALIFDPPDERSPEGHDLGASSTFGDRENSPDRGEGQVADHQTDRESADGYRHVVVQFSDRWRVVLYPTGQWIIQRRRNAGCRGAAWKSLHFCLTRKRLIELCDASCGPIALAGRAILLGLPDYCGGET